jgi:hypothetical protein
MDEIKKRGTPPLFSFAGAGREIFTIIYHLEYFLPKASRKNF